MEIFHHNRVYLVTALLYSVFVAVMSKTTNHMDGPQHHQQQQQQQQQQQPMSLNRLRPGSPLFRTAVSAQQQSHCHGSLCGGMARYPVGPGNKFYAEFDVPGLPEKIDGITDFIYFNIFFGDPKNTAGRM